MRVTKEVHGELMAARKARRDAATDQMAPRTRNRDWGFFGTCAHNGHADPEAAWDEAMAVLTDETGHFRLEPDDARNLLDATWGRHLADQVVGEEIGSAIERLACDGWAKDARAFVRRHINPNLPRVAPATHAETLEAIARRILKIETLERRKSDELDFHELAVWTIQEALEAAYDAGRQGARR
jgi:hypothetical protein